MELNSGLFKLERSETYKIFQQVTSYKTAERNDWIKDSKENREFELSRQWSPDEIKNNKDKGNYVITINVIERMLEFLTGAIASKLPEYYVYPKNKTKEQSAKLGKKILSWVFEESRGLRRIRKLVHDGLTDNIAFLYVYANEDNEVKFTNLGFQDIIIDPSSKDFMFDDAKAIFIRKKISVADAKALYGVDDLETGFPDEWRASIGAGSSTIIPGTENSYSYANTSIEELYSGDKTLIDIYERYSKIIVADKDGKKRNRIVKEVLLGYDHVVREVLPESISYYPFVAFFYKDTDNPYKIGKVHLVKEIQRFLNKINGIILKNTLTLGSPKIIAETTAIPNGDVDNFKRTLSNPNDITLINPSIDGRKGIDIIQASPTPSAPMDLYLNALNIMEFNTAPKEMIGMSNTSSQSNPAAAIYQKESVMDSLKTLSGILEDALERLGTLIMQYTKAYVKEDTIVFVADGEAALQKLELNKSHKLNFANPASIDAFKEEMRKNGMSSSEIESILIEAKSNEDYANSISEYIENDTSLIDCYIKVVPGSYASMFDSIKFQIVTMLVNMGALHPSVLIDYAPLEDKESLKLKSNTVEKAFREMQDMSAQMEEMAKEADKIKQENIKLKEQMVEVENNVRMDYLYKDARVKESKAKNDLNLHIRDVKSNTALKSKELLSALKETISEMEKEREEFTDEEYKAMVNSMNQIIQNSL